MLSFLANHVDIQSLPVEITKYLPAQKMDTTNSTNTQEIQEKKIYSPFKLPICYLDEPDIHPLTPSVSSDLELTSCVNTESVPMYEIILRPKHSFAKQMIPEWEKQFTTNVPFLKDTQSVIADMKQYSNILSSQDYSVDCDKIMEIWKSTKEDPRFLEKYSYMEWEILKYLNYSTSFLHCVSLINLVSPLTSIIIPIIFLILPFALLKIQGIPIDFPKYTEVLKEIAKNHFIGKTLSSMEKVSFNSVGYLFMTVAFYFLQIYQNVISFFRFHRNIMNINTQLYEMKNYVNYSIASMEAFVSINNNKPSYQPFICDIVKQIGVLKEVHGELCDIHPFSMSISTFNNLGYLLKCYHEIHINAQYEEALRYSIGFEGYINNKLGLFENMQSKDVCAAKFTNQKCEVTDQYYPPYAKQSHVKNSCKLTKNMIVTGVNASGKTTLLKTTTINIIFTQQFGYGFYKAFQINPYTHVHSYLNIPDTSGRDSLFQAESRRCKEIIDIIGTNKKDKRNRHFCIFDELYSGTNPVEATKSAYAFLLYLSTFPNVDFILTTHYTSICKKMRSEPRIRNYKMDVLRTAEDKLTYTYKIKPGICNIQGAIEILKTMEYPTEIINTIKNFKGSNL